MKINLSQSSIRLLWFLVCCMLGIGLVKPVHAEYHPPFDLRYCAEHAYAIVVGELDENGVLHGKRSIRVGVGETGKELTQFPLQDGKRFYTYFKSIVPNVNSVEIVAFIEKNGRVDEDDNQSQWDWVKKNGWSTVFGGAGIVALTPDKIYHYQRGFGQGNGLHEQAGYTRASFLKELFQTELRFQKQKKLLEAARSQQQAERVIDFLLQNTQPERLLGDEFFFFWKDYYSTVTKPGIAFGQIVRYFQARPVNEFELRYLKHRRKEVLPLTSPQTMELLLARLNAAKTAEQQIVLLQLLQYLVIDSRYFRKITPWTQSRFSTPIRREAFGVLYMIDSYRADEYLARYYDWVEQDLDNIYRHYGLRNFSNPSRRHPKVIAALEEMLHTWPEPRARMYGRDANRQTFVGYTIRETGHPRLLSLLYDIYRSWERVELGDFWSPSGLSPDNASQSALDAWWRKNRDVLRQEYDLNTEAGRELWFFTYRKSDQAVQKLLINLWWFSPKIEIDALLKATDGIHAEAAKAVLAELWKRDALPDKARQFIVSKFVKARLVQNEPILPGHINLQVKRETDFPFPENSWHDTHGIITFDETPATIKNMDLFGSSSLSNWNTHSYPVNFREKGQKVVHAAFLIVEKPSRPFRKKLWKHQIKIDSLVIKRSAPAKK